MPLPPTCARVGQAGGASPAPTQQTALSPPPGEVPQCAHWGGGGTADGRGSPRPHGVIARQCSHWRGNPHPPCGARKMLRAYAIPCIFRPLRKFRAPFFRRRRREPAIPPSPGQRERIAAPVCAPVRDDRASLCALRGADPRFPQANFNPSRSARHHFFSFFILHYFLFSASRSPG